MSNNLIGATTAIFFVRLSSAAADPVDVQWATRDGSAIGGTDYKPAKGVVTFLPGETEKQLEVLVYGQPVTPSDDKVFFINLSPPSNAVLVDALLTCRIVVDDSGEAPVTSIVVAEGRRGPKGAPGLSAYELAIYMGEFAGTIDEWMEKEANAARAAERAEAAAVAANIASKVFSSPEAGVNPNTGVPVGDYFNVRSPLSTHYVDEYQNVGGSAVPTGKSYPSAKGLMDAQTIAEQSAAIAEAAATAATIGAGVFDTPEAGVDPVTGVADGAYFNVRSSSDESYVDEYQNVGGSAVATGKSYLSAFGVERQKKPASTISDKSGKNQQEVNDTIMEVRSFGAIGDGVLHTVQEWTQIPSRIYYPNLAAIQVDYPHVTSLSDPIDWAAAQKAINTPNLYKLRFPCVVGLGRYEFGSKELIIPDSKSNMTFIGDGSADAGATVIRSTPNKNGFIAINSKAYATTLQDLALLSTTGNEDGFAAIGFQHMRENTGSTGRLCHRNFRIMGFSKHACKVGQAINYQFDNITFSGGVETLWIGRDAILNQRSTTVSMYHAYITGGKRCGVYLDRPSDFMADRLIIESCGKGVDPSTGTFYADAAGLIAVGVGQGQLNAPYFEDNRRNIHSNSAIVIISANYGPATLPDVWDFSNPAAADNQKGRIELLRNGIRTRYLLADEYKGYIEVADDIRFNASAKFNIELISEALFVGSSSKYGRADGVHELVINSNMSGSANIGVVGQKLNFGVTNSSVGFTSRWMTLGHRRLDNTNTALGVYVDSGTTSFAPDGAPVKLGEWNSKLGLVLAPKAAATPELNGEMTVELTNNSLLKFKVKGSDGNVREHIAPMLSTSVTYDPELLAAGEIKYWNVTLTGAKLGDFVVCAFDKALNGTRIWAEVTGANTVTVYHQNPTASPVDILSGTLSVKLV